MTPRDKFAVNVWSWKCDPDFYGLEKLYYTPCASHSNFIHEKPVSTPDVDNLQVAASFRDGGKARPAYLASGLYSLRVTHAELSIGLYYLRWPQTYYVLT